MCAWAGVLTFRIPPDKSVTVAVSMQPADGWGDPAADRGETGFFGSNGPLIEEELDFLEPPNAFGLSGVSGLRCSSSWQVVPGLGRGRGYLPPPTLP